jgi:hypothetical protein
VDDPQVPIPDGGNSTPSSSIDPAIMAELEELRSYRTEAQQVFDQLTPHQARIKRMLEDPTAAQIYDDSLSSYDMLQQRNKPKLSQEWDPETNPYLKKIDEVYDTVKNFSKQSETYQKQQQDEINQRLLQENTKLSEQLVEKFPHLAEQNYAGISMIASYGLQNKMSFADAARALEPVYRRESAEPTLRSGAGVSGVPGASEKGDNVDMVQRAAELIREQQRKAGIR